MCDFSASYLPSLNGEQDPSRSGFASEEEAEEYVFSQMCLSCQAERQRFVDGTGDDDFESEDYADSWPACACEWWVGPTESSDVLAPPQDQ